MKNNTISKVLKLTHRLQPGHITLIIIANIISVTGKFVPIVFGSLILDALVQHKPFEEILHYAFIMISIAFLQCKTSLISGNHSEATFSSVSRNTCEALSTMLCNLSIIIQQFGK